MSFSDTIFLFFLALILFGPKKLPEMARQAGKLLAELRRASNEFRSQIETEISHLEVQKTLPPDPPPQGTVASGTNAEASEPAPPHESPGTLAIPSTEAVPLVLNSGNSSPAASSDSTPLAEGVVEPSVGAPQDPHA